MPDQSGFGAISQTFRFPDATLDGLVPVLANALLTGQARTAEGLRKRNH